MERRSMAEIWEDVREQEGVYEAMRRVQSDVWERLRDIWNCCFVPDMESADDFENFMLYLICGDNGSERLESIRREPTAQWLMKRFREAYSFRTTFWLYETVGMSKEYESLFKRYVRLDDEIDVAIQLGRFEDMEEQSEADGTDSSLQ